VGYTDLVYYDVEAAKKAGYRDLPAPPTYLGTPIFIPGQSDEYLPFPPDSAPSIDHGLPGLLDGGTETEYFDTICAGDTLTCVNKLAGLLTKETKSLGTMLIIALEATYTNQDGKVVALQRAQVIPVASVYGWIKKELAILGAGSPSFRRCHDPFFHLIVSDQLPVLYG
jgi:hypothetical protein